MKLLKSKFILPFLILLLVLFFPLSIFAQTQSSSGQKTVVLTQDQIIDHDYFAAGDSVILDGTVNGDVYIAGGKIDINGTVNGDLLVAGGQVTIRGKVLQNIRAVGGNILVLGEIGNNVTLVGGSLAIDSGARIAGNAVIAGGNISVLSQVKDLTIAAGNAQIGNEVLGNITAGVGSLDISQNAVVRGNLEYWSTNKATVAKGANIEGKTIFHMTQAPERAAKSAEKAMVGIGLFFSIVAFLSSLIIGILLVWLLPVYSEKTAGIVKSKFWLSLLLGFITLIVSPVVILILMITLIGIPLGLIMLFAFGVIIYISKILVALAIGKYVSEKAKWNLNSIWAFIIGLFLYYIVGFIPVVGAIVKLIILLVGVGAIILQKKYYFLMLRNKKLV